MMLFPFLILLVAAALCLSLSRSVPTRQLGYAAALAAALAGGALLVAWRSGAAEIELTRWSVAGTLLVPVVLRLSDELLPLALLVLFGGALALLSLAAALAPRLRGFGGLFGWALLTLACSLAALCCATPLLLPFGWALLALTSGATLWSSSVPGEKVASGLVSGLLSSVLLLAGVLPAVLAGAADRPVTLDAVGAACIGLAVLLAAGVPPFRAALDGAAEAPAPLLAITAGLGLPLVAIATLMRFLAGLDSTLLLVPSWWFVALRVVAALALLACAAASLRERRLKALLTWQIAAQASAALLAVAVGSYGFLFFLGNLALMALAGALAIGPLERRGSDDYTSAAAGRLPLVAGVAWALAGASAVGLPPLWGFWAEVELIGHSTGPTSWVVPVALAASTLSALAWLLPLGAFFGRSGQASAPAGWPPLLALLPAGALVLLGVVPPTMVYRGVTLPFDPTLQRVALALLVALVVLAIVLRLLPAARRLASDPDMELATLAPDALGDALAPLALWGRSAALGAAAWRALWTLGRGAQLVAGFFERRYYLVGMLLMLIIVLLLVAQ